MNLKEPSAELDLAVAKAAGIGAALLAGECYYCDISDPNHDDFRTSPSNPKGCQAFRPSRDMTDAWDAAEKVGLFSTLCLTRPDNLCYMIYERYSGDVIDIAESAPLAICAAIIETEKEKTDA